MYKLVIIDDEPKIAEGMAALFPWNNIGFEVAGSFTSAAEALRYGSVADWVYETACGIQPLKPGFEEVLIAPHPDSRVESLSAKIDTVHGAVSSSWRHTDGRVRYEISVCVPAEIRIDGRVTRVGPGTYIF